MKNRFFAAIALLATASPALAAPPPSGQPKLLVAISVDQFSADLFAEYRGLYTAGLKRLQAGDVFPSGYQSHAATETCPGHSTILTGSHPARTDIIANNWYDLSLSRADKLVYCSEDPTVAGSSSKQYTVSPQYLKVPTLGDRLKAVSPQSRVVSVAGKDRAAIMMGGHNTDQIWYWGGKSYVTLTDRVAPTPAIVTQVNARAAKFIGAAHAPASVPAICAARAVSVPVGKRQVGVIEKRDADDFIKFRSTTDFDADTADIAIGLVADMKLGRGPATDVLAIGLSANDYVGHGYGVEGAEMCAQQVALDQTVGRILAALDKTGVPYAVVLTADHGGHDVPERNAQRAFPQAHRVSVDLTPQKIGAAIGAEVGYKGEQLLYSDGSFGDWYLAKDVDPAQRGRIVSAIKARLVAQPDVAAVFTADDLRAVAAPKPPVEEWTLAERARAAFDPARSGDFVVLLRPWVTPIPTPGDTVATHGSPWNYDRRVPIIFYRPGTTGFEQPLSVETVDILPTLAALVGLNVPASEIDGRCLDLDPGAADTCAAR